MSIVELKGRRIGLMSAALLAGVLAFPLHVSADDSSPTGGAAEAESEVGADASGTDSASATVSAEQESEVEQTPETVDADASTSGEASSEQTSGDESSTADAASSAEAVATNEGDTLLVKAAADSEATGVAVVVSETTEAGSTSTVAAGAQGGGAPTAYASAGSDVYAFAVGGDSPSAIADAGDFDTVKSTDEGGRLTTIAYTESGTYSVAVATENYARAFSSTYGNGLALTAADVYAAARTAAAAFAEADWNSARAWAESSASSSATTPGGVAAAASASRAEASIEVRLVGVRSVPSGGSGPGSESVDPHSNLAAISMERACNMEWRTWNADTNPNKGRFVCSLRGTSRTQVTQSSGRSLQLVFERVNSGTSRTVSVARTRIAPDPRAFAPSAAPESRSGERDFAIRQACRAEWMAWGQDANPDKGRFVCSLKAEAGSIPTPAPQKKPAVAAIAGDPSGDLVKGTSPTGTPYAFDAGTRLATYTMNGRTFTYRRD